MNRQLRRRQQKENNKNNNFRNKLIKAIELHTSKNFTEAERIYFELDRSFPNNYDVIRHIGILAQDTGKLEKAYNFFQQAIKLNKKGYEALNNLGAIHVLNKNQNLALKCFEKSIQIQPNYVPSINNIAGLYHRLHNREKALYFSKKALSLQPRNVLAKNQYAKALILDDRVEEGINIFREICEEYPERPDFKANLATALKEIGEFEESKNIINSCFNNDFKRLDFFAPFASDKKNKLNEEQINYYEEQLSNKDISDDDKILISHTFFTYYKNNKNFEKSGKFLELSNNLQYNLKDFDINKEIFLFDTMQKFFVKKSFNPRKNKNSIKPIFICGMPRSGTTLCEQILSTHTKISGAGELSELIKFCGLENIIQTDKKKLIEFSKNLENDDFLQDVREQYLEYLNKFVKKGELHVTDKLPHNFVLIGFIKLILPEAKIIYCKRDPIDNCFSLYSHKFVDISHQYSYNQKMLGEYYKLHKNLMNFWFNVYDDIFVLDNEKLVNNQEMISKELINFCGLKWEKACLSFHKTKRQVRTASIEQVRQPINNKSIGAWKSYEPYLSKLISTLGYQK
tara:strand:- start:1032 stop:2741 length:1710 start_codon:yes stop_codon:yes gene_type:complete